MDEPWVNTNPQDLPWLGLAEATTFPFIVFSMPRHRANTQMSFCFETPKWESQNFQN